MIKIPLIVSLVTLGGLMANKCTLNTLEWLPLIGF